MTNYILIWSNLLNYNLNVLFRRNLSRLKRKLLLKELYDGEMEYIWYGPFSLSEKMFMENLMANMILNKIDIYGS